MTSTDQHRYSRDEVVAELTSFYKFLTKLYLPSSVVKTPPPEGWPEITAEYLAPLKKTEIVVDLIRHLPFIQRDECEEPYQVYWSTAAVDFAGNYVKRQISQPKPSLDGIEPPEENGRIPSHVLTFATPAEGIHGFYFNIDTERGTIVLCDFVYGPRQTKLSQDALNEQDQWREHATYTVKEFFEYLKHKFKSLEVLPINEREVLVYEEEEAGLRKIKKIYEEHGVSSDTYDKNSCLESVKKITWWEKQ